MEQKNSTPINQVSSCNNQDGMAIRLLSFQRDLACIMEDNEFPTRQSCYTIIFPQAYSGYLWADHEKTALTSDSVLIVLPGQMKFLSLTNECKGYILSFGHEFLFPVNQVTPLFHSWSLKKMPIKIATIISCETNRILQFLEYELQNDSPLKYEIIREYTRILMIHLYSPCASIGRPDITSSQSTIVNQFFALLRENYSEKKQVSEYARLLLVSPNYLNSLLKNATGYTASHNIQQYIFQEARRQAIYSNTPIKEIAFKLGFEETAHFSRFFKNQEGISFSEYRKELKRRLFD